MKIIQLNIENFKRLTAVSITPEGSVIEITGKNAQGKSSVIDALWCALEGLRGSPVKPIRKGEEKAKITVHLAGGDQELIVTRKFTLKGSTLTVESPDGLVYRSPQAVLDALIGELSFDPLAFVAMRPDDQFKELIRVADIGLDFTALDDADAADFSARTEANREAARLTAAAAEIVLPDDLPEEPVDAAAISQEIEAGMAHNVNLESARQRLENMRSTKASFVDTIQRLKDEMADVEERETSITTEIFHAEKAAKEAAPKDVDSLRVRMRDAAAVNSAIDNAGRKARHTEDAATHQADAERLTAAMEARRGQRRDAIAEAKLPVAELGLEDGVVTFGGIPFSQASTAEQIRTSVGIAMAANPKLRVIRINEGSSLDSDGLALIAGMADAEDYQIWIERVDESGAVGVVIEDGHVAGAPPPTEPEKKPAPKKTAAKDKPDAKKAAAKPKETATHDGSGKLLF